MKVDITQKDIVMLTVVGGSISYKKVNAARRHTSTSLLGKLPKTGNSIEKRRRRRISRFANVLAALSETPKWHLVFNFDKSTKRQWDIDEAVAIFTRFTSLLKRWHPRSWFGNHPIFSSN